MPSIRPGTYFRYSNLNFPVVATVMEAATGERFDRLMDAAGAQAARPRRLLQLDDLLRRARWRARWCSTAPDGTAVKRRSRRPPPGLPGAAAAGRSCDLAAYALGSNGALFSPQGGLRISVRDLAKVGAMLLRNGGCTTAARFLSRGEPRRTMRTLALALRRRPMATPSRASTAATASPCRSSPNAAPPRRSVRRRPAAVRPCRRRLWPALRPVDRPGSAAPASPISPPAIGDEPPRGRSAYRAIEEWLAAKLRR